MSNPEPIHSTEAIAFDFTAMEQRIIASYHESIKQEVSEALKLFESRIDELLLIKSKTDKISGEMKKLKMENKTIERRCNLVERENKTLKDHLNSIENKMLECCVIMHGVEEVEDENSDQRIDKSAKWKDRPWYYKGRNLLEIIFTNFLKNLVDLIVPVNQRKILFATLEN